MQPKQILQLLILVSSLSSLCVSQVGVTFNVLETPNGSLYHWNNYAIDYYINTPLPENVLVSFSSLLTAVQASYGSWQGTSPSWVFNYVNTTSNRIDGYDNKNVMVWTDDIDEVRLHSLGGAYKAVTVFTLDPQTREISDCDILFDAVTYADDPDP